MSTIEDKILNGPQIHYCDDGDDRRYESDTGEDSPNKSTGDVTSLFSKPSDVDCSSRSNNARWTGCSTNTGPKGVIEDFKKRNQRNLSNETDDLEAEFQELLNDDSILKEYIAKRLNISNQADAKSFGHLYQLKTGAEFLDAIDNEDQNVLVIAHIYTKYSKSCAQLNRCLNVVSAEMKHIKFISLDANATNLSGNFKENGVPALLAYKKGDLVKSLVQLEEFLDKDFEADQVKELLIDNGLM